MFDLECYNHFTPQNIKLKLAVKLMTQMDNENPRVTLQLYTTVIFDSLRHYLSKVELGPVSSVGKCIRIVDLIVIL